MSALAARRAAAAASGTVTPTSEPCTPAPTSHFVATASSKKKGKGKPVKSPLPVPSDSEQEDDEDEPIVQSSSKKRRLDNGKGNKSLRYFVQEQEDEIPASGKQRGFSPSLPVSDDDGTEDDSSDALGDEEALEIQKEVNSEQGRGTRTAGMSAPRTPGYPLPEAGPSRKQVGTSRFTPTEGVNFCRVSEQVLDAARVQGSGPGVVVSLAPGENLMIVGTYAVTPLERALKMCSTELCPSQGSSYPVFAPTSHPIPVLEPSPNVKAHCSKLVDQLDLPSSFALGESIPHTVFLVREYKSGIEDLARGAVPGFSHMWPEESGVWGFRGVHPVIGSFSTPVYPYITPTSWSDALSALVSPANRTATEDVTPIIAMVKGPKRSGKSTFTRAALNNLLTTHERVAWLECDLGQGEFGCGGVVGLWVVDTPILGPPFTHPRVPIRAHYLGTYTPLTCPDEYIAAVRHLLEVFKYEIQYSSCSSSPSSTKCSDVVPLVINTQGWVKGLGEDLLNGIEASACPTHVFAFDNLSVAEDIDGLARSPLFRPSVLPAEERPLGAEEPALHVLEPAPVSPLQARYTSAVMRVLSTISYLHATLETDGREPRWTFTAPLACANPLEVELSTAGPLKAAYLIGEGSEAVLADDLSLALNGSIVALAKVDTPPDQVYTQGRGLPGLDEISVYGLAIIRGIQSAKDGGYTLRLVTPLPCSSLSKVNSLIKNGAIEMPLGGLLDWRESGQDERLFGVELDAAPFVERAGGSGVGQDRRRVRRNIMRKGA